MKQDTPYDVLHYFLRHWRVIVNIGLLSLALGAVYVFAIQKPMYKSSATVTVVDKKVASDVRVIANYAALLQSRSVLSQAAEKNGVATTALKETIAVRYDSSADMINITTTAQSAQAAQGYLRDSIVALKERAKAIYASGQVRVVDEPSLATKPHNISAATQLMVITAVGVCLAVVGLFFRYDYAVLSGKKSDLMQAPPKSIISQNAHAAAAASKAQKRAMKLGSTVRMLLIGRSG